MPCVCHVNFAPLWLCAALLAGCGPETVGDSDGETSDSSGADGTVTRCHPTPPYEVDGVNSGAVGFGVTDGGTIEDLDLRMEGELVSDGPVDVTLVYAPIDAPEIPIHLWTGEFSGEFSLHFDDEAGDERLLPLEALESVDGQGAEANYFVEFRLGSNTMSGQVDTVCIDLQLEGA